MMNTHGMFLDLASEETTLQFLVRTIQEKHQLEDWLANRIASDICDWLLASDANLFQLNKYILN